MLTRQLVPPAPSPWHDLVQIKNLVLPVALLVVYAGLVRVAERRPAHEIGLHAGFSVFLIGLVLGLAMIAAAVLVLWAAGLAEFSEGTGLTGLGSEIVVPLLTATGEELIFRVLLFGILEEVAGSLVAILISAAVFGLAHAGNPAATPLAILALSVDMGVMLALAYMLVRNAWLPIGIHAGWNFAQGFVLGLPNSGSRDPHSYIHTSLSGSQLLTGGTFGVEASIITLGLSVAMSSVLLGLVLNRRGWAGFRLRLTQAANLSLPS